MGSIGNLFSFLSSNNNPYAPAASGGGSGSGNSSSAGASYGAAFSLSLTRTIGSDGRESDEVDFSGAGYDSCGDAIGLMSQGKGSSAESAFEAMMATLNGEAGSSTQNADGSASTDDSNSPLASLFHMLDNMLDGKDGTTSGGIMALTNNNSSVPAGSAASGTGTPSATDSSGSSSEKLTQLFDSVFTSLEKDFENSFKNTANKETGAVADSSTGNKAAGGSSQDASAKDSTASNSSNATA